MNRQEKIAWSQLVLLAIAAAFSAVATVCFIWKYDYTAAEAWWLAVGYTAPILILAVVAPPVDLRKGKTKGPVDYDERDLVIDRTATRIAFGTAFIFFIGVCMTTWVAVGMDNMIPAVWLTRIVYIGWAATIAAHALATVVCYSRGDLPNE